MSWVKKHFLIGMVILGKMNAIAQNVGIGTNTPLYKLDVNGSMRISKGLTLNGDPISVLNNNPDYLVGGSINIANNTAGNNVFLRLDGSTIQSHFHWADDDYQGSTLSLNPYGGNVGIGIKTPLARLHISAENALQISNNNNPFIRLANDAGEEFAYLKLFNSSAGNTLLGGAFRGLEIGTPNTGTAGTKGILLTTRWLPRMYITPTGNVGIGTLTPGAKLDVTSTDGTAINASSGAIGISAYGQITGIKGEGETYGVRGITTNGTAILGEAIGSTGWAGQFYGKVKMTSAYVPSIYSGDAGSVFIDPGLIVNGMLIVTGSKSFKIDHPLDPENKYLVHSCVESDEMANMYNGTITTDARGYATVQLPGWFEAENEDFKYQLTCMGQFAQAIVKEGIKNNQFMLQTDKPNVKLSWMVIGNRKDVYAKAANFKAEVEKTAAEQGKYFKPELFGKPASLSVNARGQK